MKLNSRKRKKEKLENFLYIIHLQGEITGSTILRKLHYRMQ